MIRYEKIKSLSIDEMAVVMAAQFLAGYMFGCDAFKSEEEGREFVKALLDTEEGRAMIKEAKQHLLEEVNEDAETD